MNTNIDMYSVPTSERPPMWAPLNLLERKVHSGNIELSKTNFEIDKMKAELKNLEEMKESLEKGIAEFNLAIRYLKEHPISSVLLEIAKTCEEA